MCLCSVKQLINNKQFYCTPVNIAEQKVNLTSSLHIIFSLFQRTVSLKWVIFSCVSFAHKYPHA